MISSSQTNPHINAAWHEARERFGGDSYRLVNGGTCAALLVDSNVGQTEASYVIKVPHPPDSPLTSKWLASPERLPYEARLIQHLGLFALEKNPPVEIPTYIGQSDDFDRTPWIALSFIPGSALSYRQIKDFSQTELDELGVITGAIVRWLKKAIKPEAYTYLMPPPPFDPEGWFRRISIAVSDLGRREFPTLHKINDAVLADYPQLYGQSVWESRFIGHTDIRPGNLAFKRQRGHWRLTGLLDFGVTGPSNDEWELRHLGLISRRAARLALRYCQAEPGDRVTMPAGRMMPEDIVWLCSYAQALSSLVVRHKRGIKLGTIPLKMDVLLHNENWSELK